MKTIENTLEDIYAKAKEVQIKEKQRNRKIIKIASTCVSICIIFVVALAVMRPFDDKTTEDERIVLEGKNGNKKWITDIPGAVYIENPEYFLAENKAPAHLSREGVIKHLQNSVFVIGEVDNIKSFYIVENPEDEKSFIWYITTFDIKISKAVNGTFETDTLKCVTSFRYLYDGTPVARCGLCNVGKEIIDNPTGVFVVKEESPNHGWRIDGEFFSAKDYADYCVAWRYGYTSEGVLDPFLKPISLDEVTVK